MSHWNDERIEKLKKLWAEGLSCSQIASKIGGISRNAVIGKVTRLGLSGRNVPARRTSAPSARRKVHIQKNNRSQGPRGLSQAVVHVLSNFTPPPEPLFVPPSDRKPLVAFDRMGRDIGVQRDECRWIFEEPGHPHYGCCARKIVEGTSYCIDHLSAVYQPPALRRRDNSKTETPATETILEPA
jgi:GcrA cell cycle regulator